MNFRDDLSARKTYFQSLYKLNLEYKVHPGLVYLYIPSLRDRKGWDGEETLWFSTINGHTQNPITSLRIFQQSPEIPSNDREWANLETWFFDNWDGLSFDTDRRKQKKETINGLRSYANLVRDAGSSAKLWEGKSYDECWATANSVRSFGRLSTFSYLEYVRICGYGPDCTDLMFRDYDGSKSHRNGMFFLLGMDLYVWDKRQPNSHSGEYIDFSGMCENLEREAELFLESFRESVLDSPDVSRFTLESCLCQFKNGFFRRRYPGVYADMGWDRILWYESRGFSELTQVFREIREEKLPVWLREECENPVTKRKEKAERFANTGFPFRGDYLDLPTL